MATVKSLEDMLSSDYDESAVNALVGSLESQLASSNAHVTSQELSSVAVSANHVNNATHVDGNVMRLLDGQKLDIGSVVNPVGEISKSQPLAIQPNDMNCTVTTSNSTSVMVTLPGALPASGYITQVTGPPQQSLFTPSVAGIVTSRSLTVHNPDLKIVYSSPSPISHLNTVTSSNNSVYPQRNNMKITSLPNGSQSPVGIITIRANQPLVTVAAVNPIIATGSTTSMSTIHDLANIASQQTPIVIPNACQPVGTTLQGLSTSPHPAQIQVNAANGKQMIAARIQREQVNSKINDKSAKQTPQDVLATPNTAVQNTSISQVNSNILQVNNPSVVSKNHNQASQPVGIVSNSSSIISGVQIVNVNPTKITTPAVSGQRALAPRVVIGNSVRLAANPQQILAAARPGVQVAGQNTITLPHGMVRGAILVKTENGQFQVVNVAPSLPSSSSSSPISNAPTYRLQSVQPGAQVVRTMSQPMAVTVPVSVTSSTAKTTQQASVTAPQTIVGTLLQQGPQLSDVNSRLTNSIITSGPGTPVQQSVVAKVTGMNGNLTSPLSVQTTSANSQSSSPSQMSPNTAKRKCKNFLSTLIRLAEEQPVPVATSVRNLIQGLIDGTIPAEEFTAKLQKELHSAPQPYLVPFLKKNLPFLRQSLITQELTIDGIRPPPNKSMLLPPAIASVHHIQVGPKKTGAQQTATQLRLMSPASGGALTAQLLQTSPNIVAQRFPRIPATLVNQGKSLLVATSGNKSSTGVSAAALSPATVGILQAKSSVSIKSPSVTTTKDTSKRNFNSSLRDDDDINDVAAMGGVNLIEESQRILASNADIVGTQIRSCKDESFLCSSALQRRVSAIAAKLNVDEVSSDVMSLIAHAAQERLKSFVEKLGIIAEHRIENAKSDQRYEVTQDVKYQLKFLEELDRLEKRRHEEQEREVLLRAAKSRSKVEDPEQLKLKQKAKEMQRAELEELRQREANATALLAIGPRKKFKPDPVTTGVVTAGSNDFPGLNSNVPKVTSRPRVKRVNLRDFLFLMEQERDLARTPILYKAYVK